ncbi:MAG: DUF6069 family protein, partial [Sciscionella sp.]
MTQQRNTTSALRGNAALRLVALVGATAAVAAVWLIARYAANVHMHSPAFSASQRPSTLPIGLAISVAVLAGLAGWSLAALLSRR